MQSVCDTRPARLEAAKTNFPSIHTTTDVEDVLSNKTIDAVALATPVSTHFDLALRALQAGKHVFVEKPLAASSEQGEKLIKEANKRNLTLMVDHSFVYTGAVRKIKELIDNNDLGEVYYYDSTRVNLGLFQQDVNVIWDLAVHDFSIMDYVFTDKPIAVSATGHSHVEGQPVNTAHLTLFYEQNFIAFVNVNWLSPAKVRRILIGGSKKMIDYSDLEPNLKVKVYDKGIDIDRTDESKFKSLISYRTGDMSAPKLDETEALKTEIVHFADCIDNHNSPISDGEAGLRVVRILEAATDSLAQNGMPIRLDHKRKIP